LATLLVAVAFLASLIFGPLTSGPARAAANELFAPVAASAAAMPGGPGIVRSRLVTVDLGLLGGAQATADSRDPAPTTLTLNLFDDTRYTAILDRIESGPSGGYIWLGHIDGAALGSVILLVNAGRTTGQIELPGGIFEIRNVQGTTHAIAQIAQGQLPDSVNDQPLPSASTAPEEPATAPATATADGPTIDVLVAYSAQARTGAGGTTQIQDEIAAAVASTNLFFQQSGMTQRLRLVHTVEVPFNQGVGFQTALTQLTGTNDGVLDQIHALRDAYGADLVSLWVESLTGNFCGIAWLMNVPSTAFASNGFSVVARPGCAVSNKSFAHELAHNMGARHDHYVENEATDPSAVAYNYGYSSIGATAASSWRTIMAYNNECQTTFNDREGCARLGYFSNPDKTYGTPPRAMGVGEQAADAANNRLRLDTTAPFVASFRSQRPTLTTTATPATAQGGGVVTITVTSDAPLGASPTVQLSGPCIATASVAMSATATAQTYQGTYTIPVGTSTCTVAVAARGATAQGALSLGGEATFTTIAAPASTPSPTPTPTPTPSPSPSTSPVPRLADVPADYWAAAQIEAFLQFGITTGCGDDEQGRRLFCPDRGVTRAEMAAFLDRAKGQPELFPAVATFADVPTTYWAFGWIERFLALNVTTGCGADENGNRVYCPDRGVTRAEMAVFLIRAYP
jgi:hypothetical protein